jgi:sulfoxide reductase heme-binding subunit YedZ
MVLNARQTRPPDRDTPAGVRRPYRQFWRWLQVATHLAALAPLVLLALAWSGNRLGANPIRETTLRTGRAALTLLVLSLAVTPLRRLTGWAAIQRLRKPLGLYAFLYVALHLLTYVGLDFGFNLSILWPDLKQQRFIQVGLLSFLLLLPLAVTSTRRWQKRLGKNWTHLHKLVFPASILSLLHFFLLVKADIRRPLIYSTVLLVLFIIRLKWI